MPKISLLVATHSLLQAELGGRTRPHPGVWMWKKERLTQRSLFMLIMS